MEELLSKLNNMKGSYYAFVSSVAHYARKKPARLEAVLNFLNNNPDATPSDVIGFVSDQDDIYEDASCEKVS